MLDFPVGARVRSHSGAYAMTVVATGPGGVRCTWLGDHGTLHERVFDPETLVEMEPDAGVVSPGERSGSAWLTVFQPLLERMSSY